MKRHKPYPLPPKERHTRYCTDEACSADCRVARAEAEYQARLIAWGQASDRERRVAEYGTLQADLEAIRLSLIGELRRLSKTGVSRSMLARTVARVYEELAGGELDLEEAAPPTPLPDGAG